MSTGNTARIESELQEAVSALPAKCAGYHEALVKAALACITDTAEHDDRRLNINQRFDAEVERIALQLIAGREEQSE